MATTALTNLDLNLLLALEALLAERNVTRAAARLGLSQPAVSASLARLRRHFGDELLHRTGNRYELTPLAEQLVPRVGSAVFGVQRVFDTTPAFDPTTTEREFTLHLSDYALAMLGGPLTSLVSTRAPGARLRFRPNNAATVDHAFEALRGVDGIVVPPGFLAELPNLPLYEDGWTLVVDAHHPVPEGGLTLDDLGRLPWVTTYHERTAVVTVERQLQMIGVEVDVRVVADSFLALPFLVAGTDHVAVLPSTLARTLQHAAPVRLVPCPWDPVPLTESLWWHPSHRADPAHAWLRSQLQEAGRTVTDQQRSHPPTIDTVDTRP
ncbi:LysR family transcriptional regulator [Nocardioides sp. GY 10127]|uniref:LysR family transcriptional regulator n=1 Tax=Nocardioides sp. GY 10127 TaxID=2569762 RepID=UPI001F0FEB9F|nr:LysR family transcriptional regulator [Nocardioides sp. GY 10127]